MHYYIALLQRASYSWSHLKMQTLNRNVSTQIPEYSAFAEIYRFILRAVRGDSAIAKAIFERYLAGELSEELLTISRECVEADRAERHMKGGREDGRCDAFTVVS